MNTINTNDNLKQLSTTKIKQSNYRSFKSNSSNPLERVPQNDNIEIQQDYSKNQKKQNYLYKAIIGLGITATAAFLIHRGLTTQAKHLAEHIDFKKAKTIEEAIEFGKKNLGIKKYKGFEAKDLEVLNWINHGLVNTSNKHKGNLMLPKRIKYAECSNSKALAEADGLFQNFITVNKNQYNDYKISDTLIQNINNIYLKTNSSKILYRSEDIQTLKQKIADYQAGKIKDLVSKIELNNILITYQRALNNIHKEKGGLFKKLIENKTVYETLKKNHIELDLDKIEKYDVNKKQKLIRDSIHILDKNHLNYKIEFPKSDAFRTIYHEMGHIQDKEIRTVATNQCKNAAEYPKALKNWLNNKEQQAIAGKVSAYSKSGPAEFIAEAYAELITGNKLDDDVMELYKKLKGPIIPGI